VTKDTALSMSPQTNGWKLNQTPSVVKFEEVNCRQQRFTVMTWIQ